MTALTRSYALGLRTLRGTYGVAAALIAVVALMTGADLATNAGHAGYITPAQLREPLVAGVGILTAVGLSLFAAARVSGEFRHRTITLRFLAGPTCRTRCSRRCSGWTAARSRAAPRRWPCRA